MIPTTSSAWPVKVVPTTAATPIVFSSTWGSMSSGPIVYLPGLQGHDPRLDVEVAAELLPDDVDVAAEDEVRACRSALPSASRRWRHFHFSDRAPSMIASEEPWVLVPVVSPGRVEELGQHPDAALLDLEGLRVLGVVDEVPVEVLRRSRSGPRAPSRWSRRSPGSAPGCPPPQAPPRPGASRRSPPSAPRGSRRRGPSR